MRVAVLAEWYPSPADPVHGIWAHRQAVATAAAGAEVRVLVLRRPVPPLALARRLVRGDSAALAAWARTVRRDLSPWNLDGIEVVPVPWLGPPRPLSYGAWGWWMARPLSRALDALSVSWAPDLIHAHTLAPTGFAAAGWSARTHAPLVLSAHGPDMTDVPFRSGWGRRAVATALAQADLVLANSRWAARRCVELGPCAGRVRTLHLGADLTGSAPEPEGAGGAERKPRPGAAPVRRADTRLALITVAHLQARKGHATVLRAIAALDPARRPDYTIVGDGEERERLEALVLELGITERVRFLGQLPHPAALARVAEADLFVMPGVQEPFGVAFIEAMAAGRAVIGGRGEGGPEDIVATGPGMVLSTPGDVNELARWLERFDADRVTLAELGAAARETVAAHFTWTRCGERTLAAYTEVLEGRAAGR